MALEDPAPGPRRPCPPSPSRAAQLTRRGFMTAGTPRSPRSSLPARARSEEGGGGQPAASLTPGRTSDTEKSMIWANWAFYLDEDDSGGTRR